MMKQTRPGLPANWYFDSQQFAREMSAIWQQEWVCIGREMDWPEQGSFQVIPIADQNILVVRDDQGELNAFHNTCRHRGSILCENAIGHLKQGRIVCPYHSWTYNLQGQLQGTPRRVPSDDFKNEDYSLYTVALQTWGGFVFVCLAEIPARSVLEALGDDVTLLQNWPMADLQLAHRESHDVACNWKIFWENFLECYHCPGIHPDLCRLVPVYGQGFLSNEDLADVGREPTTQEGHMLRDAAQTWVADGVSGLPLIKGPTEEERARGMIFGGLLPTMFIVAHQDYVRMVRMMPLGPESTRLTVDWLLPADSMNVDQQVIDKMTSFARQVVMEDAHACELNQKGLKSSRHKNGVLLPQEYDVFAFDNWVRERLGTAP